jgi:hypothetical protein
MDDFNDFTEEDASTTDVFSLDLSLSPGGDEGSSFRTQNDPTSPYQRDNYIERKGAVDIRCSCLDVIHGLYSVKSGVFATLIVLQFRFDSRKQTRRIKSVDISLEFEAMRTGDSGPEVYAIAPMDTLSLVPTTQHEEVKRNAGLQLGGAAPVGGLTATGSVGWEKSVSKDTSDQTTVTGSIDLKGRNWGKSNCATWTLMENRTAKTGVPVALRTALLLKRKDENPFQCVVKIDSTVDIKGSFERVFGGKGRDPKDDPVLFDPDMEPTNRLCTYDVEELGALNLEGLSNVTFATMLGGVIKDKSQTQ